ncbi:50S ribosomal protein L24 [Fusibacter paucivorans]|uniref:Large ribosomal subunit protein uL24 n=1 Tax=Fusibacter paucivorans TaxID=76009 RepID=A0ABS5PSS3_9FIRM|nr:50S ribosomal protein L24 [Fusibacter paucivorans]MBS7528219.1 50S ribosomal protein L24 [Fusibacter paucivorans]
MHIKKGDTVIVIAGKDKGKKGKVLSVDPKANRVIVENVNMVTKHQKPSVKVQQGGRVHMEAPVNASNVQLFDAKANAGTRVKMKTLEDGKKVRVSVKTGEVVD